MEEVRTVLCDIFEGHFLQHKPTAVKNEWIHLKERSCVKMVTLAKTNENRLCRHLKHANGYNNKENIAKYRQLKEKEYNLISGESEEDEMNIYINPRCEYDRKCTSAQGK